MYKIYFLFFTLSVYKGYCQEVKPSQLFESYKKDKTNSLLPDFSYAGYHAGQKSLPDNKTDKIFNVLDFRAKPDDDISDREGIQAAIAAANKNGSGIIFFPKGRFLVNEDSTAAKGIVSTGSNIIFRGSGSGPGGTELFMKYPLLPEDPAKMWTSPSMFAFTTIAADDKIGDVVESSEIGQFKVRLNSTTNLKVGDWVAIKMLDNSPSLINEELAPNTADSAWTYIHKKGVDVCMYYRIVDIKNKYIYLHAPLAYKVDVKYSWTIYKFSNAEEVGIENIAFTGNFKDKFVHHSSWKHDSGFSLFEFSKCTNSWMQNCRFTDCSVAALVKQSANITIANCLVNGTAGHEAIISNHSMNVLFANLEDKASQWHSFGSSHGAINTVIWHCSYPSTTCFEAHASQPRNTLLDNVRGGLMQNRAGGAMGNMPNHLRGLVFWNYTQTNKPVQDFEFWPKNNKWWKFVTPTIAGFQGSGTTFKTEQLAYIEGLNQVVSPASLYEAQLLLRLKAMPEWLIQLKKNVEMKSQ